MTPPLMAHPVLDMNSLLAKPTMQCHVVAMPYPSGGHISPMMNLFKILALKNSNILVTFVVPEKRSSRWVSKRKKKKKGNDKIQLNN